MHIGNIIKYLLICQFLMGCNSKDQTTGLDEYTAKLGFKASPEIITAITFAAKAYNLNPEKMARIAMIESGLNPKAKNTNKNRTVDVGLFQINTVNLNGECKGIDINSLEGNSICAAKLISIHKQNADKDPFWIGRYHSKTPSLKKKYYNKYEKLGSK